jgi:uncharacterized protein DUF6600
MRDGQFSCRAIGAVLIASSTIVAAGCHRGGSTSQDPPGRVARLNELAGDVSFQAPGDSQWTKATQNYAVSSGDRLYVAPASHAELDFGQGVARVGDRGDVTVTNLSDHFAQLGIANGMMDASVYRWIPGDSIELDTPNGALIPQAAGVYRVWVDPSDNSTIVSAETGTLLVTGPGVSETLQPGQTVRLTGTNPVQLSAVNGPSGYGAPEQFVTWSAARDRRYRIAQLRPAARYVNQETPGWVDVVDEGRWITTPTNQQVWCPSNVSSSWVPYRSGRWSYVEPWGWTWVDDNSWGYTTTHYGRWTQVSSNGDCSWGWVPSSTTTAPVYAPALVSFVEGIANLAGVPSAQGWFPLGPQEPYFPWYSHSDAYLNAVNLATIGAAVALDRLLHSSNVDAIEYVNRPVALTVVPTTVVVSGVQVAPSIVHLPPGQLKKMGHVVIAPQLAPSPQVLVAGRPVLAPPVVERPQVIARGGPMTVSTTERGRGHARQVTQGQPVEAPAAPAMVSRGQGRGQERRAMTQSAAGEVVPPTPTPSSSRGHGRGNGGGGPPAQRVNPPVQRVLPTAPVPQPMPATPQRGRGSAPAPSQPAKPGKPGGGGGGGGGGGRGRGRPG